MNDTINPLENRDQRFGQNSADSNDLVRAWSESRPQIPADQWETVWSNALRIAAQPVPKPSGSVPKSFTGWLKLSAAASIAAVAWLSWPSGAPAPSGRANPSPLPTKIASGVEVETSSALAGPISINLDEAESFAVIRLDDLNCRADHPCLESVESSFNESSGGGASLASNFSLFNDLESLAND